jgi:hypothetical protein
MEPETRTLVLNLGEVEAHRWLDSALVEAEDGLG